LEASTTDPSGALNSSLHTNFQGDFVGVEASEGALLAGGAATGTEETLRWVQATNNKINKAGSTTLFVSCAVAIDLFDMHLPILFINFLIGTTLTRR
jgi:hypothetical protein